MKSNYRKFNSIQYDIIEDNGPGITFSSYSKTVFAVMVCMVYEQNKTIEEDIIQVSKNQLNRSLNQAIKSERSSRTKSVENINKKDANFGQINWQKGPILYRIFQVH